MYPFDHCASLNRLLSVVAGLFFTPSLTHFTMKRQVCTAKNRLNPVFATLLRSIHDLWLSWGQGDSTRMSISKLLDRHGTHTKYERWSPITFRPEKLHSVLKCWESRLSSVWPTYWDSTRIYLGTIIDVLMLFVPKPSSLCTFWHCEF